MSRRFQQFIRFTKLLSFRPTIVANARSFQFKPSLLGKIVQFKLSDIGEGIAEVQVKEWFVKPGDTVKEFDNICEVQSDKASVTITSRYAGIIKHLHHQIDDIARLGQPLVDIEVDDIESKSSDQAEAAEDVTGPSEPNNTATIATASAEIVPPYTKPLTTPAVRLLAREMKVDLSKVQASGKNNRVLKEDILRHTGNIGSNALSALQKEDGRDLSSVDDYPSGRITDRIQPIRGYARAMVKTMALTTEIPHFGYCEEVRVDRLVELRSQLKIEAARLGIKMSYMPLFIKAASLALLQYPILNASLDANLENVIYKASHNICIAIDTAEGLVVPNVKNCESKNLWQIAKDLNRLHESAKLSKLSERDLLDGTFTLSNIGSIGGTYCHPVIMPPQVSIGALGRIQVVPRITGNNEVCPVHVVNVSWSADHRVIDGATMARFCNVWKQYLENPALMIAEMR